MLKLKGMFRDFWATKAPNFFDTHHIDRCLYSKFQVDVILRWQDMPGHQILKNAKIYIICFVKTVLFLQRSYWSESSFRICNKISMCGEKCTSDQRINIPLLNAKLIFIASSLFHMAWLADTKIQIGEAEICPSIAPAPLRTWVLILILLWPLSDFVRNSCVQISQFSSVELVENTEIYHQGSMFQCSGTLQIGLFQYSSFVVL